MDGIIAAASIRVMFDFEPRREEATILEGRLIQGHMRIAYSVPRHREYFRSGTPSEPVLAEAAAQILNSLDDRGEDSHTFGAISRILSNGLISKGERGELVARLLLTLVHDKCIRARSIESRKLAQYSQPIPLLTFLEALVGKEHMEKLKNAIPNNNVTNGQTLEEAFKHAKVNFTHFVKGADNTIISDFAAWAALVRNMGFQCANRQYLIDLLIPILLWDRELSRWVVSALLIQVKNRLNPRPVTIDIDKLGFFSNTDAAPEDQRDEANTRPYITIVMELGIRQIFKKAAGPTPSTSGESMSSKVGVAPSPSKVQPGRSKKAVTKIKHPRYAFTTVGCSHKVYDVIEEHKKKQYASLLTVYDILDEHPRQDIAYRQVILSMKPYWSARVGSYQWAEEQEVDITEDEVVEEVRLDPKVETED